MLTTRTLYLHVLPILCLLFVNNCWAEYDLDVKFDEINEKLDILLEVEVQTTGNTSDGSGPEQGMGDGDGDDDVPPFELGVEVVEIRRESLGSDEIQFIIKYRSSVDFVMRWCDYDHRVKGPVKQEKITRTDDVQETSYITRASNSSYDYVYLIYYLEEKIYLSYWLSKYVNADNLATDVVPPVLGAAPTGDFVYGDGENVTIKLRVPVPNFELNIAQVDEERDEVHFYDRGPDDVYDVLEVKLRVPIPNFELNMAQVDEERDEVHFYDLGPDDAYDVLEVKNESDSQVLTVRLNTVKYNASGFVTVTASKGNDSKTALVKEISVRLRNVLRPSSQAGPLPEGFLGFQVFVGVATTTSGCSVDSNCDIQCTAFGEDITDLSVYRLEPDGSRTRMDGLFSDVDSGIGLLDYVRTISGPLPLPGKAGTVEYQCVAENAQGVTKTQTRTYTYALPLKIDQDQSGIHIVHENDSSTIRRFAVVCSARGYPQPIITFDIKQFNYYGYAVPPDEIVDNGNNQYTATKFVTFDTRDLFGWGGEYNGKLNEAECKAVTKSPEGYIIGTVYYYMKPPPDDIGK